MALVVEDGTGLSAAETPVSVADADAYFLRRGVTAWAPLAGPDKETKLIQGTEFVSSEFGQRFSGIRLKATQALPFPRVGIVDEETNLIIDPSPLPVNYVRAVLEATRAFIENDPYDPSGSDSGGGVVIEERKKVGPLETTKKYSTSVTSTAGQFALPPVTMDRVSALLQPLLKDTFGFTQLRTERA